MKRWENSPYGFIQKDEVGLRLIQKYYGLIFFLTKLFCGWFYMIIDDFCDNVFCENISWSEKCCIEKIFEYGITSFHEKVILNKLLFDNNDKQKRLVMFW